MQQHTKKQAKNSKLTTIRSFIAGEDVMQDLLTTSNALAVTFFETSHNVDSDTILVNGMRVTMQEYEQILAQSALPWIEEKSYEDSELIKHSEPLAASGLNHVPACRGKEQDFNEAANEPANRPTREHLHRLYLQAELKRLQVQETIDLQTRDKMIWWSKVNGGSL